jgi:hypothetical protein
MVINQIRIIALVKLKQTNWPHLSCSPPHTTYFQLLLPKTDHIQWFGAVVIHQFSIQKMVGNLTEIFHGLPQSLHSNSGMVP